MHHVRYYYLIRFDQINEINRTDEILELWDRLLNASAVGTIFHMFSISITMLIKNHNSHKYSNTLLQEDFQRKSKGVIVIGLYGNRNEATEH